MNELQKIISAAEAEIQLLFHKLPVAVKHVEDEALHVCNVVKTALQSPEAAAIEAALAQLLPGNWESTVLTGIEKGLNITIPLITNQEGHASGTIIDNVKALVDYLRTLSPYMQHAGLLKLLSGILHTISPDLTEVAADTAAQVIYAKSTLKAAA